MSEILKYLFVFLVVPPALISLFCAGIPWVMAQIRTNFGWLGVLGIGLFAWLILYLIGRVMFAEKIEQHRRSGG